MQKTSKTRQRPRTSRDTSASVRWQPDGRRPHREPVEACAAASRGLSLPERAGRGALRRQGEIAAFARPFVLPGRLERHAPGHPADGRPRRDDRDDRHPDGGRGAASRAEPGQAAPAAVQRAAPRRQVVPVHRRHRRGRLPAGHVHPRAAPARRRLLRAVCEREEGARDARRAQPGVPVPAVRRPAAGSAQRHPVPRLPHRALPCAVRRLHLEGGLRRADRAGDRVPVGRRPADQEAARAADARGGDRGAVRGRRALPEPSRGDRAAERAAGGRAEVDRHDRRRRRRRLRGTGRGAGLPVARGPDGRPLLVPPRERRRRGPGRGAGAVLPRVLRLGAVDSAADPRPERLGRYARARGVPVGAPGLARRGARAGAR